MFPQISSRRIKEDLPHAHAILNASGSVGAAAHERLIGTGHGSMQHMDMGLPRRDISWIAEEIADHILIG
jgi:hypothetical protein